MSIHRGVLVTCVVLLALSLSSCAAPAPEAKTEPPTFARQLEWAAPLATAVKADRRLISATNAPLRAFARPRTGYVVTYQVDRLDAMSVRIQSVDRELANCVALPRGETGLLDVEFYRVLEAVRDGADVHEVAGIVRLGPAWYPAATVKVGPKDYPASDCYLVGESVESLAAGPTTESAGLHVVYLNDEAFDDAVYVGPLERLLP